ncbi:DUF2336 domain-containing protein [Maricaulis sp. D1M11]|uniref:DUF2336 domain-containing protein n=1 Tax=Maricaulis sp. D1M11 TaxID=3076117 RepID=UPI0039B6B6BD
MSVVTLRNRLTEQDIRRLVKGDDEDRANAASKICRRVDSGALTQAEREAAEGILEMIASDAAELVRRAMAVTLRNSPHLPHDIACKLAADIETVALPLLMSSPVLTDDDLLELLDTSNTVKRKAIASREQVGTAVVKKILETGDEAVVNVVAANNGASFDSECYQDAMERYGDKTEIMDSFVARSHLPVAITEKLISKISDEAMQRLVKTHALPPQLAVEIAEESRERATVDLVDQAGLAENPRHFVQQLRLNGRLTPSLVLRATLRGHIVFMEHALAELAGVSHAKAWLLVHDAGPLGLRAIYDRTGLPSRIFPALRAALDVYHALETPHDRDGRARFRRQLAERAITRFQGLPEDDLEYVLDRFDEDMRVAMAS